MKNTIYKIIFRFCRFWVRCYTHRYKVCSSNNSAAPGVYIVHHQNLRGPVISVAWFNKPVHPWVLGVFCDRKTCFRQYYDYTFTKRFGLPKVLAAVIAFPLSFFVSVLMRSIQAIPVFRSSKDIIKTFRQSISALTGGQNILISPDIEYTDSGSNMGEMYNGFLNLEKYYMKQTGCHLAFIPLHISREKRCIYEGQTVYFNADENFKEERSKVYRKLKEEFSRLEGQANS